MSLFFSSSSLLLLLNLTFYIFILIINEFYFFHAPCPMPHVFCIFCVIAMLVVCHIKKSCLAVDGGKLMNYFKYVQIYKYNILWYKNNGNTYNNNNLKCSTTKALFLFFLCYKLLLLFTAYFLPLSVLESHCWKNSGVKWFTNRAVQIANYIQTPLYRYKKRLLS